ncbi:MAG: HD domain-containing protein [Oscillospiraceae bacterium]|nr:HD domain-containing protein [Oscillospiraceae bacterium]
MKRQKIKAFFLYCTLSGDEYDSIRPLIWSRNLRILRITSLLAAVMGGLFLLVNLLTRSGVWQPYLLLMLGSAILCLLAGILRRKGAGEAFTIWLCYLEMLFVCLYAGFLSTQQSNYSIPATSIVVFIALLPLTIDDRPIRMYLVMICESALYLFTSRFLKSGSAFSLDLINVATFCAVGITLYSVICTRNVREIYQSQRLERIQKTVISSMATVVEERDEQTGGHIRRTEQYVKSLIERMKQQEKYAGLTDEYYNNVILAAPMHDVGKIRIPDTILNKPGRLTDEEFEIMKKHAVYGAEIIQKTMRDVENEDYYAIAGKIAKYHHERYDGKGYPEGLKGEEIPLEARMMTLADVYDALISERVYKKALSREKARAIIEEGRGTQFDPDLAALFLQCIE